MKFDHTVKYNGKFYETGDDVPMGAEVKDSAPGPAGGEPAKSLTKTDINKMPTADLQVLAKSEGIEGADSMTGGELKRKLIEKYGL